MQVSTPRFFDTAAARAKAGVLLIAVTHPMAMLHSMNSAIKSIGVFILVAGLTGCMHWQSYGTWTYSPTPGERSDYAPTPVPLAVTFDFNPVRGNPAVPGARADKIVFIQLIRLSDPTAPGTGTFKSLFDTFPGTDYFPRQTESGWSIDVSDTRKMAYYGLDDDGSPIVPVITIPGNNGPMPTVAYLHDRPSFSSTVYGPNLPGGTPRERLFEAIDAAVCVEGDALTKNRILGFLYWQIRADKNNNILWATAKINDDDYMVVVQEAIAAWNAHLSGKTAVPPLKYFGSPP